MITISAEKLYELCVERFNEKSDKFEQRRRGRIQIGKLLLLPDTQINHVIIVSEINNLKTKSLQDLKWNHPKNCQLKTWR